MSPVEIRNCIDSSLQCLSLAASPLPPCLPSGWSTRAHKRACTHTGGKVVQNAGEEKQKKLNTGLSDGKEGGETEVGKGGRTSRKQKEEKGNAEEESRNADGEESGGERE